MASAAARRVSVEFSPLPALCRRPIQRTTVEPGYLLRCRRCGCQVPCPPLQHENRCLLGKCRTGLQRPRPTSRQRHILSPAPLSICASRYLRTLRRQFDSVFEQVFCRNSFARDALSGLADRQARRTIHQCLARSSARVGRMQKLFAVTCAGCTAQLVNFINASSTASSMEPPVPQSQNVLPSSSITPRLLSTSLWPGQTSAAGHNSKTRNSAGKASLKVTSNPLPQRTTRTR